MTVPTSRDETAWSENIEYSNLHSESSRNIVNVIEGRGHLKRLEGAKRGGQLDDLERYKIS